MFVNCCLFFFFKQKTAYEMRISDWSSDVCSSDLPMIENIPFNDDNIAGFRIDGRLTAEAYDGIRDVVDAKLARHQKLRIYVEIANEDRKSTRLNSSQ